MDAYHSNLLQFNGLRGEGPESIDYIRPTIKRVLPENTGDWIKTWFRLPRVVFTREGTAVVLHRRDRWWLVVALALALALAVWWRG